KCSFPPCSSTLVVVEQHVALAQPRSRRCSPRKSALLGDSEFVLDAKVPCWLWRGQLK
ncbi:hypothetical protein ACJX0J_034077, partial [Zea mays]